MYGDSESSLEKLVGFLLELVEKLGVGCNVEAEAVFS